MSVIANPNGRSPAHPKNHTPWRQLVGASAVVFTLLALFRLSNGTVAGHRLVLDLLICWWLLFLYVILTRFCRPWLNQRATNMGQAFVFNFLLISAGWLGAIFLARFTLGNHQGLLPHFLIILLLLWCYEVVFDHYALVRQGLDLLGQHLSHSRERNRKLAALIRKTEYRNLMARTGPHFLFNTLSGIRALVRREPVRAEQAITDLAELFRLTHHELDKRRVLLEDELALVSRYFALQVIRFDKRLNYEVEVNPPALSAAACPPFLLQPLVENSIQHAVEPAPNGGWVKVGIFAGARHLFMRVEDSGYHPTLHKGSGTALSDMKKRLAAIYGDHAGMDWSFAPEGSHVEIHIPLEWSKHETSFLSTLSGR